MTINKINIDPLIKAFSKFEEFRKNLKTEQDRAGAIQAFEYCFELSWKILKRHLEARGSIANSPREVLRMAALEQLIDDPEMWFEFLKKRNLTVHTYEEEEAQAVISVFPSFSTELTKLLKTLDK